MQDKFDAIIIACVFDVITIIIACTFEAITIIFACDLKQ